MAGAGVTERHATPVHLRGVGTLTARAAAACYEFLALTDPDAPQAAVPAGEVLSPATGGRRGAKLALVGVVVTLLVVAQRLGVFQRVSDPAALTRTLLELGPWGYVAFVVAYAALQPWGIPGTVFVFAAALVWPWQIAFGLSMTGTMAASVVGFLFARFVARDWVSSKIPERFKKYEVALARRGFVTVFLLRLIFWMPPLLHAFFGVSRVRFSTHFWGSLAGYVLPLLAMSFFGQRLFEALRAAPPSVWAAVGATVVTAVALALGARWLARSRARARTRAAMLATASLADE